MEDCPAAGHAPPEPGLADADTWLGPASGVGLPAAGIPRLEDIVRFVEDSTALREHLPAMLAYRREWGVASA